MKNTGLKRVPVKYIRDKAKSDYVKASFCQICGETEDLDFHHYYSVSTLVSRWMAKEKLLPDDVLEWRDRFIEEHRVELYDETVTLCNTHHKKLHTVYGIEPPLVTASKQKRWVEIQRQKYVVA